MGTSAVGLDERAAYDASARWFVDTAAYAEGHWDEPGLGTWTVRDLVGHTGRALVTVEQYLDVEPGEVTVATATAYFRALRGSDPGGVDERARAAGRAMGDAPHDFLTTLAQRALAKVAGSPDDAFVGSAAGGMRLVDYLPTRTFELVVHTSDLCGALRRPAAPPRDGLASALALAASLLSHGDQGLDVLRALTGRGGLPEGFSVLGGL